MNPPSKLLSYATQLPGPSVVSGPHWAVHDRLIKPRFTLQNSPGDFEPRVFNGPTPILAVGLLTMAQEQKRRQIARRTMHERFRSLLAREVVVLRYLLPLQEPDDPSLDDENATHGDLVRLVTPEGATHCWDKVILWYRWALRTFPLAQYVGVADDDVYLSLPRLAADLAGLSASGHRRVYWGQPMWMAYWNESRFEGEGFGGTSSERDWEALSKFTAVAQRLNASVARNRMSAAARRSPAQCATYNSRGAWSAAPFASGPFFFANTDLAILGADLVRRVLDGRCLANLNESLRTAERTGTWRRRLEYPCEPNIDQLLGYLVMHAARNVTYVQAQFHTQGFPWMTYQHNRPGASAMYVHKLGSDVWNWRYADALLAREGPFVAMPRECRPCYDRARPGETWVSRASPSASLYAKWTCCATLPRVMPGSDSLDRCTKERASRRAAGETFRFRGQALTLRDGYCAPTDDTDRMQRGNRSCARVENPSVRGYWKLMRDPQRAHTLSDCVRRCLGCAACKYVSFSESHFQRECSWYAACPRYESNRLERIGSELCPTFSTVKVVRPATGTNEA